MMSKFALLLRTKEHHHQLGPKQPLSNATDDRYRRRCCSNVGYDDIANQTVVNGASHRCSKATGE